MKIGILTFHWATNYGAVLQCYALQTYLESQGHKVVVVNYKPHQWTTVFSNLLHARSFKELRRVLTPSLRESALKKFRSEKLHETKRVYRCAQIPSVVEKLDAVISGSDQVLSTSFLTNGDGKNVFTPSYYLGFPFEGKKITYAASFGCTKYPEDLVNKVSGYVCDLSNIGVREKTGKDIVATLGRDDAIVVPDPTALLSSEAYISIAGNCKKQLPCDFVFCFFIRNIEERRIQLSKSVQVNTFWNNDDKDYSLEGWLKNIREAKFVVTDSFHCVMMCLKMHTPFVIIADHQGNVGMNDRMYTLMEVVGLQNRILHRTELDKIQDTIHSIISWQEVDNKLKQYMSVGQTFLSNCN